MTADQANGQILATQQKFIWKCHSQWIESYLNPHATPGDDTSAKLSLRPPFTTAVQWHLLILAFLGLKAFLSFLLYVVQHFATRGSSVLLSDFWRPISKVLQVTKLAGRCFICDLALVSSPEDACGFRYDSNHRVQYTNFRFITLINKQKQLQPT